MSEIVEQREAVANSFERLQNSDDGNDGKCDENSKNQFEEEQGQESNETLERNTTPYIEGEQLTTTHRPQNQTQQTDDVLRSKRNQEQVVGGADLEIGTEEEASFLPDGACTLDDNQITTPEGQTSEEEQQTQQTYDGVESKRNQNQVHVVVDDQEKETTDETLTLLYTDSDIEKNQIEKYQGKKAIELKLHVESNVECELIRPNEQHSDQQPQEEVVGEERDCEAQVEDQQDMVSKGRLEETKTEGQQNDQQKHQRGGNSANSKRNKDKLVESEQDEARESSSPNSAGEKRQVKDHHNRSRSNKTKKRNDGDNKRSRKSRRNRKQIFYSDEENESQGDDDYVPDSDQEKVSQVEEIYDSDDSDILESKRAVKKPIRENRRRGKQARKSGRNLKQKFYGDQKEENRTVDACSDSDSESEKKLGHRSKRSKIKSGRSAAGKQITKSKHQQSDQNRKKKDNVKGTSKSGRTSKPQEDIGKETHCEIKQTRKSKKLEKDGVNSMGQIVVGGQVIGQIYCGSSDDLEVESHEDKSLDSEAEEVHTFSAADPDSHSEAEEVHTFSAAEPDSHSEAEEVHTFSAADPDSHSEAEEVHTFSAAEPDSDGTEVYNLSPPVSHSEDEGDERIPKKNEEEKHKKERDDRWVEGHRGKKSKGNLIPNTAGEQVTESKQEQDDEHQQTEQNRSNVKPIRKSKRNRKQTFYVNQDNENQEEDSYNPDSDQQKESQEEDSATECEEAKTEVRKKRTKKNRKRKQTFDGNQDNGSQEDLDSDQRKASQEEDSIPECDKAKTVVKRKRTKKRKREVKEKKPVLYIKSVEMKPKLYGKVWQRKRYVYAKVQCDVCGKEVNRHNFKGHMALHGETGNKICELCGKSFGITRRLTYHMKTKHSKRDFYPCSVCGKQYATVSYLRWHEFSSHKEAFPNQEFTGSKPWGSKRKTPCSYPDCKQEYYRKRARLAHEARVHGAERDKTFSVSCDICNKSFTSNFNMKRHKVTHMENPRPYKCSYCTAYFTQRSSQKAHERKHTGELPYTCKYCPKKFTQSSNKNAHEKRCKAASERDALLKPGRLGTKRSPKKPDKLPTKSDRVAEQVALMNWTNNIYPTEQLIDIPLITPPPRPTPGVVVEPISFKTDIPSEVLIPESHRVQNQVVHDQVKSESELTHL